MRILEAAYSRDRRSARNDPYEDLAISIVQSAVDDYRILRRMVRYASKIDKPIIEGRLVEIKQFFNSDYGDLLCFGHANFIWSCLQKEYQWTS